MATPHPIATRRADALERVAETFLAGEKGERSGGDRYMVNIHTEVETLTANGKGAESECEDCGNVSAETSRRMACDASVVRWHEVVGAGHAGDIVSMAHSYISTGHTGCNEAQRLRLPLPGLYLQQVCRRPPHSALGRWWRNQHG